ncbi:tetratricopeptide repeat protein, partial [Escherichia coli]|nr:tetratricopeptide repeat protein [Escherichia coli]
LKGYAAVCQLKKEYQKAFDSIISV